MRIVLLNTRHNDNLVARTAEAMGLNQIVVCPPREHKMGNLYGGRGQVEITGVHLEDLMNNPVYKPLIALEIHPDATPLGEAAIDEDGTYLFGNETHGLPKEVLRSVDKIITIPQFGNIGCLTIISSVSMLLWEWRRQSKDRFAEVVKRRSTSWRYKQCS